MSRGPGKPDEQIGDHNRCNPPSESGNESNDQSLDHSSLFSRNPMPLTTAADPLRSPMNPTPK